MTKHKEIAEIYIFYTSQTLIEKSDLHYKLDESGNSLLHMTCIT